MKTYAKPIILTTLTLLMSFYIGAVDVNAQTSEGVLMEMEVMPEYPGGMEAMFKYIGDNLKYPASAKEKGIEGTVVVKFIVNKDGSISDTEILRGIGGGCDEESLRIVNSFPSWKPGENEGEKVRAQMRLPIRYKL
ncbi:energy transducer TonB [Algoriphagus sp.]|uniref:energy transducer TonB n=1 Tax=Algoriphagus sp. TaxID=1872435 RepID=UPI0025EF3EC0|nr:energy transducer TonB [Algoriphagus sp.]